MRVWATRLHGHRDLFGDTREGFRHPVPPGEHRSLAHLEDASMAHPSAKQRLPGGGLYRKLDADTQRGPTPGSSPRSSDTSVELCSCLSPSRLRCGPRQVGLFYFRPRTRRDADVRGNVAGFNKGPKPESTERHAERTTVTNLGRSVHESVHRKDPSQIEREQGWRDHHHGTDRQIELGTLHVTQIPDRPSSSFSTWAKPNPEASITFVGMRTTGPGLACTPGYPRKSQSAPRLGFGRVKLPVPSRQWRKTGFGQISS